MRDIFGGFTELMRGIITQDIILIFGALAMILGFLCMIALYISILRVHFAIKRDGNEPPGLGPISLIEYTYAFKATKPQYKKQLQYQAEHGVPWISIDYALIQPYIKPIDRFFARTWLYSVALLIASFPIGYWLYPEIFS